MTAPLQITHATWTARNDIAHEKAANDLVAAEAAELEVNMQAEHQLGPGGLDEDDTWMLEEDIDHLLSLPGHEQHNWLEDIRMAWEECAAEHPDEVPGLTTLGGAMLEELMQAECTLGAATLNNTDK